MSENFENYVRPYKGRPSYTENGQKHKKLFFLAPERARTVLNVFLECIYVDKMTVMDVAYMVGTRNRINRIESNDHITWPFMVRFRLNLGLNNLKFVHKSISAVESNRFDPIGSIRSIRCNPIDAIRSIRFDSNYVTSMTVILSKYIHSKNTFKTVLARSGAEKNSFLCF